MTLKVISDATSNNQEEHSKFTRADAELSRVFPKRNIQRVQFVVPPDADSSMFSYGTAKRGRYWNYPPYGAACIASHLRRANIDVNIINLNNEVLKAARLSKSEKEFQFDSIWKSALKEGIESFQPNIIGITCMFSQTHASAVQILGEIKSLFPNTPIAMGGVHITNCLVSDKTSEKLVEELGASDFFFTYEAELAFLDFVKAVNKELPVQNLSQVYFNKTKDKIFFTDRSLPSEEHLDLLPSHDLMQESELSKYGTIGSFYCLKENGTLFSTVLSNRGCRARCTFCSVRNFNGDGVRSRSVQSVIDELLILKNEYGIGHIMWLDDDLLKGEKRAIELFNEMVRQNVGITWDCTNGVIAASCTEEVIAAAAASGCLGLNIGMESGNPKILRDIRKPGTVEKFLEAAAVMRKYEMINARVFLMVGFPGETYEMLLDTINVAKTMDLDWYNVTILQPLPNTPIFNAMLEQGLIQNLSFSEIHYNSGAYGKHRKQAELKNADMLSSEFSSAFNQTDLTKIPPKDQLDDIWAYMNYHLNFKRLFFETRPVKLLQQIKYVQNITDLVAPENAFAMYFFGYLQKKVYGTISQQIIERLDERLKTSPYWQDRFNEFGLSLEHLKSEVFPSENPNEDVENQSNCSKTVTLPNISSEHL